MDIEFPPGTHRHQSGKFTRSDYDFVLEAPDRSCLFCLSDAQRRALLPLLETMGWKTRWFSQSGATISQDYIVSLRDALIGELMTDHCDVNGLLVDIGTKLDTLQTDLTALTATVDEMETDVDHIEDIVTEIDTDADEILSAITALDTSTTVNIFDFSIINNYQDNLQLQIILASLAAPPVGLPDKIWANKNDGTTKSYFAAYCTLTALAKRWIRTCLYRYIYLLDATNSALPAIYVDLVTAGGYMTGGIFLAGAIAGAPPTVSQAITAINDTTAVDTVTCDLAAALANRTLDYAGWKAAVLSLAYTSGTDAYWLNYVVQGVALLDDALQANYASFITAYLPEYAVQFALNPNSACCAPVFCGAHQWDFTNLDLLPIVINRGKVVSGVGIVGVATDFDPNSTGMDISIYYPTSCAFVNTSFRIKYAFNSLPANVSNNKTFFEAYELVAGVETLYASNYILNSSWPPVAVPAPGLAAGSFTINGTGHVTSRIRVCSNTPYYGHGGAVQTNSICPFFEIL